MSCRFLLVGVSGFEPEATPASRRCRGGLKYKRPRVLTETKNKKEDRPDGQSSFLVGVSGFEPEATPASRRCRGGLKYKRPRVLTKTKNKKEDRLDGQSSFLVGVSGFEPEASWTRTKRDTKLRHTPIARLL